MWEYAAVLALSLGALVVSVLAFTKNPSQTVRTMAQDSFNESNATRMHLAAMKVELQGTLDAISDERERAQKAQARARSSVQRAEAGNGPEQPRSREELVASHRKQAGMT
ncbi:unnamed protein product [marine sediment metagenome]|uniref:Uncharacterized protein n=1 Tax=marine sediment metagenome TaxID=412755 RepID=X1J8S8_9ZZZZ